MATKRYNNKKKNGNKIVDISIPVKEGMVVWPNSIGPDFKIKKGDLWTETEVNMNLHTGTHIDAPLHRVRGGATIDEVPMDAFMGKALVLDLPEVKIITAKDLRGVKGADRLLFKTSNSKSRQNKFNKHFVGLSPDAAKWIVDHKIKLVGTDYLSVAQFDKQPEVHQILLGKDVVILEGLNLSGVKPGIYQLICLPIKLVGTEAAPVRAILIK